MENHGYSDEVINSACFFCEYKDENETDEDEDCAICPGVLVSPRFFCQNKSYPYDSKPRKFYKKLLQLNEKRKAK